MLRSSTHPSNNYLNGSSMAPVVLLAGLATAFIIKKTMHQGTKNGPAKYEKRAKHEEGNDEKSADLVL
jgi:hypothetical protein